MLRYNPIQYSELHTEFQDDKNGNPYLSSQLDLIRNAKIFKKYREHIFKILES